MARGCAAQATSGPGPTARSSCAARGGDCGSPEPVWLRLADEDEECIHLEVICAEVQEEEKRSLADAIVDLLAGGATLTRTELREKLRVQNSRLGEALARLEQHGRIARLASGWRLLDARQRDAPEGESSSKGAA
jgi:hypothetical protein